MGKFNELISGKLPVLVCFYDSNYNKDNNSALELQLLANQLQGKAQVLKIDIVLNQELAQALRIKVSPTLLLYKNKIMIWRQSSSIQADHLAKVLSPLL
ncbi:thioredoxin family protein [Myroides sp. LJL119]